MEEKEEQPTPEVEVTAGDTIENQPEKPVQRENETFLDMMMRVMMEWFDRLERDNKEMMEELCQKMDNNTKKIQLWREEIKNNGKPALKEIPNDKNEEQLNKEIENKEDTSAVLTENKHNRNKENSKHIEINTKGVKNQVIQKTKKIGKIRPKKIINTREGLEMIKGGLLHVLNLPINERELIKFKNYNRNSLIEILNVNHNKIVRKNLNKAILKLNIPATEMYHTRSVIL